MGGRGLRGNTGVRSKRSNSKVGQTTCRGHTESFMLRPILLEEKFEFHREIKQSLTHPWPPLLSFFFCSSFLQSESSSERVYSLFDTTHSSGRIPREKYSAIDSGGTKQEGNPAHEAHGVELTPARTRTFTRTVHRTCENLTEQVQTLWVFRPRNALLPTSINRSMRARAGAS